MLTSIKKSLPLWLLGAVLAVGTAQQLSAGVAAAADDIEVAYKRELATLEAEKSTLRKSLEKAQSESAQKIVSAKGEIDSLQGSVLATSLMADRLEEQLSEAERGTSSGEDAGDLMEALLAQAGSELAKADKKLPAVKDQNDVAGRLAQINFAFATAIPVLMDYSKVSLKDGEYFDLAGKKVKGKVLSIGRIATLAASENASGVLAPAGGEVLKLWPEAGTSGPAKEMIAGGKPAFIPLFIYESLEKGVEKRAEKTLADMMESGGIIGWVIFIAGGIALLMVMLRAFWLFQAAANTDKLVSNMQPLVESGKIDEAIAIGKKAKNAAGRVLVATLRNLHRERAELDDIVSEAILHEQPYIDRFASGIIVIAAVAPLLGLLGTVTGMIATFDIITEFGTGNPKLLSSGISVALVTTEQGLIVAIPALLFGNFLAGWGESIKDALDKSALRLINLSAGVRLSRLGTASILPPAATPAAESK